MPKTSTPPFEWVQVFGKPFTPTHNRAKIALNGKTFDIIFYGKSYGYRGWYQATLDGKEVSKPFAKFDPLVRALAKL